MPELSRFYGIVIQMYFGDHEPPHFHARYAGAIAKVSIETLEVIDGKLPKRATELVLEWAAIHQDELRRAFRRVVAMQAPEKIQPLD